MVRSVWQLNLTGTVARLCNLLHMVLKVGKAAGPRCGSVLVLVTPSMLLAVRSLARTCWTGSSATWELQYLAPHASALALCQGKLV